MNSLNILQRIKQWNAGVLRTYLLAQEEASDTCRLLPAQELRFCNWNTRGQFGPAALSQTAREQIKVPQENGRKIRYPLPPKNMVGFSIS